MKKLYDELINYGDVEKDVSLTTLTTLRVGGIARYVVYPKDALTLMELMKMLKERKCPYKFFGKGSNILCSDKKYNGVVIKLDRYLADFYFEDNELVAQAGASIIALSYEAMKKEKSGLEFASGIPATVGGCLYMNAGAYRSNMADVVKEVLVLKNNKLEWITNKQCDFSYRHSIFQDNLDWVIVAARFSLKSGKENDIRDLIDQRRKRRMDSQPLDKPSCGSVFRNPDDKPAWQFIEELGFRGKTIGDVKVSEKHANFIINNGHAKANDFIKMVKDIQAKAKKKYDIDLVMEVEKFNW